jgi:hypothetical protein
MWKHIPTVYFYVCNDAPDDSQSYIIHNKNPTPQNSYSIHRAALTTLNKLITPTDFANKKVEFNNSYWMLN